MAKGKAQSKRIDVLKGVKYPAQCSKCFAKIPSPKTSRFERRPVVRKVGKDWALICSFCISMSPLSKAWIDKFGETDVNGMPVGKDKKPCSLNEAFGFRKFKTVNGKREAFYVKKKAQSK